MIIVRQLELTLATLALMAVSAHADVGWAVFAMAFIGGHTISRYDAGARRSQLAGDHPPS